MAKKLEIRRVPGSRSVFMDTGESEGGAIWYVDSVNGTNGAGYGREPRAGALASLAYLITNATTLGLAAGDDVELAADHNEGIANAQIALATASLTIYGHPQAIGSRRPTFDFDHANAEITVGANNIEIRNVILRPSITDVLIGIQISSAITGTKLKDIEWAIGEDGAGADEFVKALHLVSGNHDTVMQDLKILAHASAAGATHGIHIDAASNRLTFKGVIIDGPYATNGILEDAAGLNHVYVGNMIDVTGTDNGLNAASTFAARSGNLAGGAPEDAADNLIGADNNNNAVATSSVVANQDGSVLERLEQIQEATNIGTGTSLGANSSLVDALGTNGVAVTDAAVSVLGAIGANNANNAFDSTSVVANADGSVLEREEAIQAEVNKIDSVTLATAPVANSLAAFVASGGTALGTELGDSASIVDAIGSDGVAAAAGTAASAVSVLGAIGTNEADVTTPFDSSNVESNADGTVLERQELIQTVVGPTVDITTTDSLHGKVGTDTEMADRSLYDLINGGGPAAAATAAKAANDVPLYGVAAYTQACIEQCVEKTDGTVLNGNDDIFTISGGPVFAQIYGEVTTQIGGAANGRLKITTTSPAATFDLNAGAVAIDADIVGTLYYNTGATSVFTPDGNNALLLDPVTLEPTWFYLSPGTVHFNSSAAQAGAIKWFMRWRPLSPSSRVVAAA